MATECCVAAVAAAVVVLVVGATPLALGLCAACVVTMAPALIVMARLEGRSVDD